MNVYTKDEIIKKYGNGIDTKEPITLYVGHEYNSVTEGWGTTYFDSILNAFESIPKRNEVPYKIVVKDGTYTDMQEKYAGSESSGYEGILFQNQKKCNYSFRIK